MGLLQKVSQASQHYFNDIKRGGYVLGLAALAAVFILRSGYALAIQQFGVLAWKLVLIGVGVHVAHKARTALFPYIDLSEATKGDTANGSRLFLGICILTSAIILALCAGL